LKNLSGKGNFKYLNKNRGIGLGVKGVTDGYKRRYKEGI
jgi:hypothetical protein